MKYEECSDTEERGQEWNVESRGQIFEKVVVCFLHNYLPTCKLAYKNVPAANDIHSC